MIESCIILVIDDRLMGRSVFTVYRNGFTLGIAKSTAVLLIDKNKWVFLMVTPAPSVYEPNPNL